jgi:dCMP deaminase
MSSDPPVDPQLSRQRLSRPKLFMETAKLYAMRSSCLRAHVGAVAIREGRVVAAGYAGAPAGQRECMLDGCILENGKCVRSVHAEANLVSWAARTGTMLRNCEVYCTHFPCLNCAKLLHNAGIQTVVWESQYESQSAREHDQVLDLLDLRDYQYR